MSKEYQDFELGPDGLETKVNSVRFLSLDQLEKVLNLPGLQVIRIHRGSGKSVMETEGFRKALEAWETKHIIEGQITFFEPHPDRRLLRFMDSEIVNHRPTADDHMIDLFRYAMLPGLSPGKTQMQTDAFLSIMENEWPITPKPKKTYKPRQFQPSKGDAPRSCNPNPKTVAKNRAKNKAAKAARKNK